MGDKPTLGEEIMELVTGRNALSTRDVYEALDRKHSINCINVTCKKLNSKGRLAVFRTKYFSPCYVYGISDEACLKYLKEIKTLPEFAERFLEKLARRNFMTNIELRKEFEKYQLKILDRLFVERNPLIKKFDYSHDISVYYYPVYEQQLSYYLSNGFRETLEDYSRLKSESNLRGAELEKKFAAFLESIGWKVYIRKAFKSKDIFRIVDIFATKEIGLGIKDFLFCEVKSGREMLGLWDMLSLEKIRQRWFNGNGWIVGLSEKNRINYRVFKLMPERSTILNWNKMQVMESGMKMEASVK